MIHEGFISCFFLGRKNSVASPGVRTGKTLPRAYILLLQCPLSGWSTFFQLDCNLKSKIFVHVLNMMVHGDSDGVL